MILRPIEIEDLEFAYKLENDLSLWDTTCVTAPVSYHQLEEYILTNNHDIYADRQLRLIIDVDGKAVGFADLNNFDPKQSHAEIGMTIMKDCAGKGYGHDAVRLLTEYARKANIHMLYAIVAADNSACIKVLEDEGFSRSGILQDWIYDGKDYGTAYVLQFICQ